MTYDIEFADYFIKKRNRGLKIEDLEGLLKREVSFMAHLPEDLIFIDEDLMEKFYWAETPLDVQVLLAGMQVSKKDFKVCLNDRNVSKISAAEERKRQLMQRSSYIRNAERMQEEMNNYMGFVNPEMIKKSAAEGSGGKPWNG